MRTVLRATSGHRFWEPHNYGQRAQAWAERDRRRVEDFLLALLGKSGDGDRVYYLAIEMEGAESAFWESDALVLAAENARLAKAIEADLRERKMNSSKATPAKVNPKAGTQGSKTGSQPLGNEQPAHAGTKVILDTNVARELGEVTDEPSFMGTFEKMAKAGFAFHLADGAFAELLEQRTRGSMGNDVFDRMIARLNRILDGDVPIFPGNRDIRAYIGEDRESDGWTLEDFVSVSQRSFACLREAKVDPVKAQPGTDSEAVLQEARDGWIKQFEQMLREFPLTDQDNELGGPTFGKFVRRLDETTNLPHPPMSKRLDLGIRYAWRQHVRRNRGDEPYKPESPRRRNDGIDFELYYFMMLPCLLVTSDGGFGKRLDPIKSFQRAWIYTPEALAKAHEAKALTAPTWP